MIPRETTDDVIRRSLRELMETIPFASITVNDICLNCQVSKTTFYRYFKDKYDLLEQIYMSDLEPLIMKAETQEDYAWRNALGDSLDFVIKYLAFYRNAAKHSRLENSLSETSIDFDVDCAARIISRDSPEFCNDARNMFILRTYITGYRTMLEKMAAAGEPFDKEMLTDYILGCMPETVREVLL